MPLTGGTLAASLKMACDLTGATYAIYWVNTKGELVVASTYDSPESKAALEAKGKPGSFAEASKMLVLDLFGPGPVATAAMSNDVVFLPSVTAAGDFKRQALAQEYDVESICMLPFEAGVLEIGTTASWSAAPELRPIPKQEMREAFDDFGAKYTMLWAESGGKFSVIADYKIPERIAALKSKRGDDKTYVTETRAMTLPADGDSYVATVARTGEATFISKAGEDPKLERKDLAKEFSVDGIHFVPVKSGVLEYGIPGELKLFGDTLAAALKMRCESSGAGYSIYWTQEDGEFVVAGQYATPECQAAFEAAGLKDAFGKANEGLKVSGAGSSPVATCASTLKPVFVLDASADESMGRKDLVAKYGVASICFKPTEGGVIEFGTLKGSGSAEWTAMPKCPDLPKPEMRKAFGEENAVYMMFWQKKAETEPFFVIGQYELTERTRVLKAKRNDDETFASKSQNLVLATGGDSFVSGAADSGQPMIIADASAETSFNRRELAIEFGIGEIHVVPCKDGVLEYGKAKWW